MKLSEVDINRLRDLPIEAKTKIIFDLPDTSHEGSDAALLLGCTPDVAAERARAAARLYLEGKTKFICPSGGVCHSVGEEEISEADYMARILLDAGVPERAIVFEREARTTLENMLCGNVALSRAVGFHKIGRVCIVTSEWHLRRSLALAYEFLPRHTEISGCAAPSGDISRKNWHLTDSSVAAVDNEILLIKRFIDRGVFEDIEF